MHTHANDGAVLCCLCSLFWQLCRVHGLVQLQRVDDAVREYRGVARELSADAAAVAEAARRPECQGPALMLRLVGAQLAHLSGSSQRALGALLNLLAELKAPTALASSAGAASGDGDGGGAAAATPTAAATGAKGTPQRVSASRAVVAALSPTQRVWWGARVLAHATKLLVGLGSHQAAASLCEAEIRHAVGVLSPPASATTATATASATASGSTAAGAGGGAGADNGSQATAATSSGAQQVLLFLYSLLGRVYLEVSRTPHALQSRLLSRSFIYALIMLLCCVVPSQAGNVAAAQRCFDRGAVCIPDAGSTLR